MNELPPLHFAIIEHFADNEEHDAANVYEALSADYGTYKLLTIPDIEEALATAKENGILGETRHEIAEGEHGFRQYYRITEFGIDMVGRYLK